MYSIETGAVSAREEKSMHPLWKEYYVSYIVLKTNLTSRSRYGFPTAPGGVIDLTVDDKVFYFNEYSGELTLKFPKAERKFKGGILAYVSSSPFSHDAHESFQTEMVCEMIDWLR